MSENKPNQLAVVLADKLKALDSFAETNNLTLLTEGKGGFSAAIAMADAIGQLKEMLSADVMKPIMALQGTALGFKTDKDSTGGYGVEVVRDALIEATLKGFKMIGNQSNIIGGRWYPTKEGFEDWMLRQSRAGKLTDFRDSYSVPKIASENEAIVTCSATWKWQGTADSLKDVQIPIRVNKMQGADAILGKAKRKLLARVVSRATGTTVTDGDVTDGDAINVDARPVSESAAQPGGATSETPAGANEEQKQLLKELIGEHAEKANAWLLANNAIPQGGTYLDVKAKMAAKIIGKPKDFITAIGAA